MLGFVFGFNARLRRLQFFFASIALAIVMTLICVLIAMAAFKQASPSVLRATDMLASWPILGAAGLFGIGTFVLQSMRIRDIGWDPVCVIPAWFAVLIIDHLVAIRFPAFAIGQEHQATPVGALVNLGLMLALVFWPGGDSERACANPDQSRRSAAKPSLATDRMARVAQGASRPTWRY